MALMEKSDVWTDDGSLEESENGSLSEWNEAEQQGYLYTIEGTIWQVDEVLGMLEEYTASILGPDGEYTTDYVYSDMLTDNCMRYESTCTESDSYCTSSVTEAMTMQADETGRILLEGATLTGASYPDEDFVSSSRVDWHSEMTESRLLLTMDAAASNSYQSDQAMTLTADFALGQEEATGLTNRASGTLSVLMDMMDERFSVSMDLDMMLSSLPEGELLPMAVEAVNPFEADEETLAQLMADLEALFMQTIGSLIPAPETPSSVGGALLG